MNWLFERPGRPQRVALVVVILALVLLVAILWFRVASLASSTRTPDVAASPAVSPSERLSPDQRLATPGPASPSASEPLTGQGPDATFTPAPVETIPQAFTDLGDPRPVALRSVRAWLAGRNSDLEGDLLPGVLDEALANPPRRGARINGTARVTEPGPTASVVVVPTSRGDLSVSLVVVNRERWMVEAFGWGPAQ